MRTRSSPDGAHLPDFASRVLDVADAIPPGRGYNDVIRARESLAR